MTHPHEEDIRTWLLTLALRCEPRKSENLDVLTRDYAKTLTDLPYEAFCPASREAASIEFDSFPAYKQLRKFLTTWAAKHVSKPSPLLPPIEDANLSAEEIALARSWQNTRNVGDIEIRLGMYRLKWDRVFRYIVRTDAEAAAIARRRGWLFADDHVDASVGGIARNLVKLEGLAGQGALGTALASFGLTILRKNVVRHAPERVLLLPERMMPLREKRRSVDDQLRTLAPEVEAAAAAKFEATHGRKMGAVAPGQLREAYAKQPEARDPRANVVTPFRQKPPETTRNLESETPAPVVLWVPPWERQTA